jgi:hypothetical protein
MNKLKTYELKEIDGGFSLTGTIVEAFTKGLETILDIGRSFGSSLRRLNEGKLCEISSKN